MVANISNIQQVYNSIPSRFIFEDITYDNYQFLTELHFQHGWRNVVIPEINQGQKLENDYVLIENIVTKLVINLTPEEIAELKTNDLTLRITNAFTYLRQRALASSIGKPISLGWEYIKEQADQYRYKYAVANGDIVDANMMASIEDEAQDFGITSEQMKQLIIERFLQGQSAYLFFTGMIERGRTKALTKLEVLDFESAEEIVILMENVPEVLSMEDAVELNNQMLSI